MLLAEETRWTQRGNPQPNAVLTTGFTETMDYIVRAIRKIRGQNFRLVVFICGSLLTKAVLLIAGEAESGPGFRSRALKVPTTGKIGFAQIPGSITGITFTNRLSDAAAAANQIRMNGSGVAAGDVDGDGWCDLYFCSLEGGNRLYHNLGGWRFRDVTDQAGVRCAGQYSTGAVFADVDGDGDLDLLVNSIGGGTRLFLNDAKGNFQEATNPGLLRKLGAMTMALGDVDGDGTLDLYVANYATTKIEDRPNAKFGAKTVNGKPTIPSTDGGPTTCPELTNRYF